MVWFFAPFSIFIKKTAEHVQSVDEKIRTTQNRRFGGFLWCFDFSHHLVFYKRRPRAFFFPRQASKQAPTAFPLLCFGVIQTITPNLDTKKGAFHKLSLLIHQNCRIVTIRQTHDYDLLTGGKEDRVLHDVGGWKSMVSCPFVCRVQTCSETDVNHHSHTQKKVHFTNSHFWYIKIVELSQFDKPTITTCWLVVKKTAHINSPHVHRLCLVDFLEAGFIPCVVICSKITQKKG